MHDFFTVVERLPELKLNIRSQRLKSSNFYYKSTTSFVMLHKKFEDTLKKYREAAEQSPGDIRIHIKIAELYLEYGKKDKAVEEYLLAAKGYQDKNLPQIVVAIYNNIISIDPAQVDVYTKLAEIHLRNDFIGDCVAVLEKLANVIKCKV